MTLTRTRSFLSLSLVTSSLAAAGCGGGGTPEPVDPVLPSSLIAYMTPGGSILRAVGPDGEGDRLLTDAVPSVEQFAAHRDFQRGFTIIAAVAEAGACLGFACSVAEASWRPVAAVDTGRPRGECADDGEPTRP